MTDLEMEQKIKSQYPSANVVVVDLTGTQDHFEVRIQEPSFKGLTRIQQHKKVMEIFSQELASGEVHALAIKTLNI